jgi:hypothetical protein
VERCEAGYLLFKAAKMKGGVKVSFIIMMMARLL